MRHDSRRNSPSAASSTCHFSTVNLYIAHPSSSTVDRSIQFHSAFLQPHICFISSLPPTHPVAFRVPENQEKCTPALYCPSLSPAWPPLTPPLRPRQVGHKLCRPLRRNHRQPANATTALPRTTWMTCSTSSVTSVPPSGMLRSTRVSPSNSAHGEPHVTSDLPSHFSASTLILTSAQSTAGRDSQITNISFAG